MKFREALQRLGATSSTTLDEARTLFRRKAMKAHPDYGGDGAEFHKLKQALDVVKSKHKCTACDGRGKVSAKRGFSTYWVECPKCKRGGK